MTVEIPDGFVLSDSAMYSFVCQDVFPDIISFAAAIPEHLKPLFLIPIKLEKSTTASEISRRVARRIIADGVTPTGDTEDADLFGTKTFVNDDAEPTLPGTEEGSIFRIDDAQSMTHHQEDNYDENIQVPTETSYNTDVDMTEYFEYPYRADETVRHSSKRVSRPIIVRLALKPEIIEPHTPEKIQKNARACSVSLTSYDKKTRVFTFSVNCGNGAKTVQASLSDINEVALVCNCPFWQWNGPEHNAQSNDFLLGQPYGTASPPDVRDPNREYWLCKHSYAVLRKLDSFVQEIVSENWEKDDAELLEEVDEEWDRLEGVAEIPLEDLDDEEIEAEWEEEEPEAEELTEPEPEGGPAEPPPAPEDEQEQDEDYSGDDDESEPQLKPVPMSQEQFDEKIGEAEGDDYSGDEPDEPEAEQVPEEPEEPEAEPEDYSGDDDEEQDDGKK